MLQFNAGKLSDVLDGLHQDCFSGAVYIDATVSGDGPVRSRVVMFQQGMVTYAGNSLPDPIEFSEDIGRKFKLKVMEAAIQLASKKVQNTASIRSFIALYVRLDLFKWDDIEQLMKTQILLTLDQLWPYGGTLRTVDSVEFDLSYGQAGHGFDWQQICLDLTQRQLGWASLAPAIPSMEAVPQCLVAADHPSVTDPYAQQHLQLWINGRRSILEIAQELERDPLELGHLYLHWLKMSWITFGANSPTTHLSLAVPAQAQNLPCVLSVDDSLVVQTMIKRAICDRYHVLTASNAVDALNLLNKHSVALMLLDVTMPDIDGFELCRTIRGIAKFRDLPVIMLTAKDGLVNKVKGQMAGSTQYLTKPVERDKLLKAIEKYIPSLAVIA